MLDPFYPVVPDSGWVVRLVAAGTRLIQLRVKDQPGVLAKITGTLGDHGISIASVIQHDVSASSNAGVPLVIMTHACAPSAVQRAVAVIDTSDVVRGNSVCLSVLEE